MKFNVLGSDSETGQSLQMVIDAPSLEDAAAAARRKQIDVVSVAPAEAPRCAAPTPVVVRRGPTLTLSRGAALRKFLAVVLTGTAVAFLVVPEATIAAGALVLVALAVFAFAPRSRDRLRLALGVWPHRRVRGALKLGVLGFSGVVLLALGAVGVDLRATTRQQEERRLADEAALRERRARAGREVTAKIAAVEEALRAGDVAAAEARAREATAVADAPNRGDAARLLAKIEFPSKPDRVLDILSKMPEAEFEAFRSRGEVPKGLELGFDVLTKGAVEVARDRLDAAAEARARLAEEARARAEAARQKAERLAAERRAKAEREKAARKAREEAGRREVKSKLDAYLAALRESPVVKRVEVQRIGESWTATITVGNLWHVRHKQIRYQDAQALWSVWANIASPSRPDSARIKIVDLMGNEVGGSRILGGSLIWVQD